MGWAKDAAERIAAVVRPPGGSMRGRIESGQLVTLERATLADLSVGDAVFVRWKSGYLLHLIKQIDGERLLIGNNVGRINGWMDAGAVLAKVTNVAD
jgi:hypothetical protein